MDHRLHTFTKMHLNVLTRMEPCHKIPIRSSISSSCEGMCRVLRMKSSQCPEPAEKDRIPCFLWTMKPIYTSGHPGCACVVLRARMPKIHDVSTALLKIIVTAPQHVESKSPSAMTVGTTAGLLKEKRMPATTPSEWACGLSPDPNKVLTVKSQQILHTSRHALAAEACEGAASHLQSKLLGCSSKQLTKPSQTRSNSRNCPS